MQDQGLSDDDLRLVNALQIRPRAGWSALARAIGSDPVTLTRRWERMTARGLAWIAAYRGRGATMALLEIDCAPADVLTVAEQLAHDPEVLTIDLTSGNRDILVTYVSPDRDRLSSYVLDRMTTLPLVRSLRTQVASSVTADARRWRLRALDPVEVAALEAEPEPRARPTTVDDATVTTLLAILAGNPRITVTALAAELGMPKPRAGSLLAEALTSGRVVLRTEIARPFSEWPVYAWYFLAVEARDRVATARRLATLQEARIVASMIGTYDVALAVWVRSLDDVPKLETYLAVHVPQARVVDRSIVLRTPHHLNRRIDVQGRSFPPAP